MRGLLAAGALLWCTAAFAQSSSPIADLLPPLAEKIAAATASAPVTIAPVASAGNPDLDRTAAAELARLLTARGIRIVSAGTSGAATVSAGCGANLRERVCVAEIRRGEARDVVSSVAAHDGRGPNEHVGAIRGVALEATPLFAQRAPILDVLTLDDRLIVLDPAAVTLYRRTADDWQRVTARSIAPRTWPRDVRGRLRVSGTLLEAFLPGVVCRTSPDLANLSCADQHEPWPLAIDNGGLDALRNTFQTPEGTPFLSAAALSQDAGARSAVVTAAHALVLMDDARTAVATIGDADDVASVTGACGSGAFIVTTTATPNAPTDTLYLTRVDARRATAAATPIVLPGRVTALWSLPGSAVATAVVRDPTIERHEAFQIRLSCDR
jgi:hypothetical protein